MRRNLAQQRPHHAFAALGAGLLQQDIGLLCGGWLDFPTENASAKSGQQFLFLAGGVKQHHHADVGAGEMLHQARQKLNFIVRQCAGVVHDPDFGRSVMEFGAHRVFDGVVLQHFVKTGDQGVRAGGKADFQADVRRRFAQAGDQ